MDDPIDVFNRALECSRAPDRMAEAISGYRQAAEAGLAEAQVNLGSLYERGCSSLPPNYIEARRWYEAAATGGLAAAQFNLARLCAAGLGGPKDVGAAMRWYRLAAKSGHASAMINLGHLLSSPGERPADSEVAFDWFLRAANLGDPLGQRLVGWSYLTGHGVPKNFDTGIAWLERAVATGDAEAALELARAHMSRRWYGLVPAWKYLVFAADDEKVWAASKGPYILRVLLALAALGVLGSVVTGLWIWLG